MDEIARKPMFEHDGCPCCVFRGHVGGEDIYTCRDTVMRRYGSAPEEYQSMFGASLSTAAALDETWDAVQLFLGYGR